MPNDLTTQRNSLNWRTDTRQSLENKGFFPRGGGVFIWTISGLTLAACSDIEDFLGLDDGGARGPVRFMPPTDPVERAAQEMALMPLENSQGGWQLQVTATSTRILEDGTESPIVSYGFVLDGDTTNPTQTHPDGFTIDNDGLITLASGTFDFEAQNSFTLIVQATDTPINADDEARTGRQTYRITVGNEDEGDSVYEIVGDVAVGETLEVRRISEDPDGEGAISVVWYRGTASTPTGTRGTTYLVTADDEGETIGAVISYIDGANEPESIDITASSVAFASGMGSRPIGVDEGTIATTTTLATVSATSELGEAVTYAIGTASDHDNALFTVNSSGEISLNAAGTWDYESDKKQYVVEVIASASDGDSGMDTARARITFNVQNVDETGMRTYEIDAPATLEVGSVLTAQRVAGSDEDPDGVDENSIEYVWLADDVVIPGATSATYTIDGDDDLSAIYTVRVMYYDGYHAALAANDPDRMRTEIEVSTSPIKLAGAPYTGSVNEDGTSATLPQIMASVDGASANQITYEFLVDGSTSVADQGFSISQTTGQISTFNPSFDYEPTPRITLTVRVFYDADGNAGTTNDIETRDVQVVIDVGDVNEAPAVEGVQVTANDPLAMAGIPTLAGATTGIDTLTGTAGADHIAGGDGADEITSGGGNDHIFGDAGNDTISLSTDADNVETIYYRFASSDSGDFAATDGTDTIKGFRRGEDKLVLIDTDGTLITLNDFLSDTHREQGGNLFVVPLLDSATGTILIGVQIDFGNTNALRIEYATDSQVADVRDTGGGLWQTAGDPYVGTNGANIVSGGVLNDNTLLRNYFNVNSDDDNLQVIGTADIPTIFGADVFISERRNFEDSAFATVTTSDPDAETSLNGQIARYTITGGTGELLFVIDETSGEISVKDQVTLDYDAATSYTLVITARDGGSPAMEGDHTITIGLIEDFVSEYSISKTGNTYSADLDTPDSDGVDMASIEYQWFTTPDGGTTKNDITGIAVTNQKTLDTTGYTLPDGQTYGVTITYTDNADNEETSEAYAHSVSFAFETRTGDVSVGFTGNFPAVNADFTATAIGGGTVDYSTGGTDGNLFEIREQSGRHNLYFKTTPSLTAGETLELTVIATEDAGGTTDSVAVTITVTATSPAIIPDRQAFAHQDPYEPDELGLTPMPDADPSAG